MSRLADVCLLGAIACIHYSTGAASFDQLAAWLAQHAQVPGLLIASAILLVMAVVLKSAQLPFHGWLTQVMEAPTPVSALLHAGVINLGGLLMIRLSPLMVRVPAAQWLLVGVGMTTTVVASLIMTTRISIKVSLAWSTCAQMGFMLVQCGLGLWHLALLHLVAHSLYKAHAFLASGRAVQNWRLREFVFSHRPPSPSSARPWIVGSMASMVSVSVVASVFHWGAVWHSSTTDGSIVLLLALGLGLTSLWGESNRSLRSRVHRIASVVAIASLYFGSHGLASWLFPSLKAASVSPVAQLLVIGGFALLFSLQWVLRLRPNSAMAKQLYPKLFAGLYLDEWFTRITFRAWPPRLPQARLQRQAAPKQLPIEA